MIGALLPLLMSNAVDMSALRGHPNYPQYAADRSRTVHPSLSDFVMLFDATGTACYLVGPGVSLVVPKAGEPRLLREGEAVPRPPRGARPGRGSSFRERPSPDGKVTLVSDGFNFGSRVGESPVTWLTDSGSTDSRVQWGAVPWVYGEEWGQQLAFDWAKDGKSFWVSRFDNSPVRRFPFPTKWSSTAPGLRMLDYPKAGDPNPIAELYVSGWPSSGLQKVDGTDDDAQAYLFGPQFLPTGDLIYQTANRPQSVRRLHRLAPGNANPEVIWEERVTGGYVPSEWSPKWVEGRLLVLTEKNGFANWAVALGPGQGKVLTHHSFDVQTLIGSSKTHLVYSARGGITPYTRRTHALPLSGGAPVAVSAADADARTALDPTGTWHLTASQTADGSITFRRGAVAQPSQGEIIHMVKANPQLGLTREPFISADGKTPLMMNLHLPAAASGPVPLIVRAYAGPETSDFNWGANRLSAITKLGWAVASIETRGGLHRGQAFRNASYQALGVAEVDDLAAGVNHLVKKGLIDGSRVGITGTSYGGYASIMALLRHPNVFLAAVANSSVTDWRHYDTIYTERYLGLPQHAAKAYEAGSAMTYAKNMKGDLLLFFGMQDDNVHPHNSMDLLEELGGLGKFPSVILDPSAGHEGLPEEVMLAFFAQSFAR